MHQPPTRIRSRRPTPLALLALASLAFAAPATAVTAGLNEIGALLVLPVLTGSQSSEMVTAATVTNTGEAVTLHINVISGDPDDQWRAQNFDCPLTASETVHFVFQHSGGGSELRYECGGDTVQGVRLLAQNGVMVVTLQDPASGDTLNDNQIFGDAVVLDPVAGAAYSVGAISFQGGMPGVPGSEDRRYRFDNQEYTSFPAVLATNYVTSESGTLVLFTLDGTVGSQQPPRAALGIEFGGTRGSTHSSGHQFDCFDIVDMDRIDGRFGGPGAEKARHMQLRPEPVAYLDTAHDSQFDGGPGSVLGVRVPPVHGWLFQLYTDSYGGPVAAFGRTLSQSRLPLEPSPGDVPVLNAR